MATQSTFEHPQRRLLQISPSSLDVLAALRVDRLIPQAEEGGYFTKVFRAHPLTAHKRRVDFSPNHEVIEFKLPGLVRPRVPRPLRALGIIWHLLSIVSTLAVVVLRENITIIRATDPYLCGIIGLAVARLTRRPFCVSIHSDYDLCYQTSGEVGAPAFLGSRAMAKAVERFVLRRADLVLPIRQHLVPGVVASGAHQDRIMVIPHGIDEKPFLSPLDPSFGLRLGLPEGVPVLSFAGRFSKENLVDDLAGLVRRLARETEDFVLVMAGDGVELERFRSMRETDPVMERHLLLPGSLPLADVAELRKLSRASLCLMGGFSLIEACAAASPVISYDIDWHAELVLDGQTGFLCPLGDTALLAQRVLSLLRDKESSQRMGMAAREVVLARHTLQAATGARVRAYDALLRMAHAR